MKVALVIGKEFPDLNPGIRSDLRDVLDSLPIVTLFHPYVSEDCKLKSSYYKRYDICFEIEDNKKYNYSHGFILLGTKREYKKFDNIFSKTNFYLIKKDEWKEKLLNIICQEVKKADKEQKNSLIENQSSNHFLKQYFRRTNVKKKSRKIRKYIRNADSDLLNIKDIYSIDNNKLLNNLDDFLESKRKQEFVFLHKEEMDSTFIIRHHLKRLFSVNNLLEDIIYLEINDFSKDIKSFKEIVKKYYGSIITWEFLKNNVQNKKIICVINHEKLNKNKLEKIKKFKSEIETISYKIIRLVNKNVNENFSSDDEKYFYDEFSLAQVKYNIATNIKYGEVDNELLKFKPSITNVLKDQDYFNAMINYENKLLQNHRIISYSDVFHNKVYKVALDKRLRASQKRNFIKKFTTKIINNLKKSDLNEIDLNGVYYSKGDLNFKLALTYILYIYFKNNKFNEIKSVTNRIKDDYEESYLWSTSLYLTDLIKGKKINEFVKYLNFNFDEKLLDYTLRYNNMYGGSTIALVREVSKENIKFAQNIHKIVMKNYLKYGFYYQAYYFIRNSKRFFEEELKSKIDYFQKNILRAIGKEKQKINFLLKDNNEANLKMYKYYFDIDDFKKIRKNKLSKMEKGILDDNDSLKRIIERIQSEREKILVREKYVELLSKNINQLDYDNFIDIFKFSREYCFKNGYLGDFKIISETIFDRLNKEAVSLTQEQKDIFSEHGRLTDKLVKKLDKDNLKLN